FSPATRHAFCAHETINYRSSMATKNSGTNCDDLLSEASDRAGRPELPAKPPSTAPRLTEKDVVGLKYFDQLLPLFERLHDDGCGRDKAGNRILHYDQYCLMLFPPM